MNSRLEESGNFLWRLSEKICGSGGKKTSTPEVGTSQLPTSHASDKPAKSRHSPPTSRPLSVEYHTPLDGLEGISAVWCNRDRWEEFKNYLSGLKEGEDSQGQEISSIRYATFLELYVRLNSLEMAGSSEQERQQAQDNIVTHSEEFFSRERCLKCIDGGMRKEVLKRLKENPPSVSNFATVYPRVVDKLSELLGNYQNSLTEKIQQAEHR